MKKVIIFSIFIIIIILCLFFLRSIKRRAKMVENKFYISKCLFSLVKFNDVVSPKFRSKQNDSLIGVKIVVTKSYYIDSLTSVHQTFASRIERGQQGTEQKINSFRLINNKNEDVSNFYFGIDKIQTLEATKCIGCKDSIIYTYVGSAYFPNIENLVQAFNRNDSEIIGEKLQNTPFYFWRKSTTIDTLVLDLMIDNSDYRLILQPDKISEVVIGNVSN